MDNGAFGTRPARDGTHGMICLVVWSGKGCVKQWKLLTDRVHLYTYLPAHLHDRTHFWTAKVGSLQPSQRTNRYVRVVQVAEAIGEGEGVRTDEKDVDVETAIDNGGGGQVYEREGVNLTPGNEGPSGGPMKMMAVGGAEEEGVANST